MINLQQYHLENILVERADEFPGLDLRWAHQVTAITPGSETVELTLQTPEGPYHVSCDWLVACDGARSPTRRLMGLESRGQIFHDRFLIADVLMKADYPTERWFWFDPPFHPGQSVLLHRQADNVWRVDFQLGWDADPERERLPERVLPRLRAMMGEREFELVWTSVYTFQCRRMDHFRHGRILFAGDSAHQVSPFGARGANSGIQDADALGWRLAAIVRGEASDRVLDHWAFEREAAADENILNSTRSTDFITPKSAAARALRDACLELAAHLPFARRLVNSGRLSVPSVADGSPANTPDPGPTDPCTAPGMRPGAPSADAPLTDAQGQPTWWLRAISDPGFHLLAFDDDGTLLANEALESLVQHLKAIRSPGLHLHAMRPMDKPPAHTAPAPETERPAPDPGDALRVSTWHDAQGLLRERCAAEHGTTLLLRPDQHVCARWRGFDPQAITVAMARALGTDPTACTTEHGAP